MNNTIENFFWDRVICPACACLMEDHKNTGTCSCCDMNCWGAEVSEFLYMPKIRVYQEKDKDSMQHHMWRGGCTACFGLWAYWHPGAALGFAFHHVRSCSRFRYALSLVTPGQSPVSLRERISSSSGRQRTDGIQVGPPWVPSFPSPLFTLPAGFEAAQYNPFPYGWCTNCGSALVVTQGMMPYCPKECKD